MKKLSLSLLSMILLIALISSSFMVSAESAVTQSGEAKTGEAVVDGVIDEIWANATAYNLDIIKVGTDTGVKAYYKLLWTPTRLYGLVVVPDTTPNHEAADNYKKDSIEVAMDFSNARTEAFENDDQFNITVFGSGDGIAFGKDGNGMLTEDEFISAVTQSATGYIYEFAVYCDKVSITLSADKVISFDVQVNDNALGDGERTACYAWNDDGDQVWQNPTYMGEVKLLATEAAAAPAIIEEPAPEEPAAEEPAAIPAETPVEAPAAEVAPVTAATSAPQTSDGMLVMAMLAVLAAVAFVAVKKVRVK